MEAKELRIGNYIMFSKNDCTAGQPVKFEIQDFIVIKKIRPIPLTEDWLISAGFMQSGRHWTNLVIDLDYITQDDFFEYEIQFPFLDWQKHDLKYVHQLQNLYFALTGEELTFKI